ncbi:MAG: hypothetical protein ACD_78C00197G0001, partial [uncultured bacterium (gcode 4)]
MRYREDQDTFIVFVLMQKSNYFKSISFPRKL